MPLGRLKRGVLVMVDKVLYSKLVARAIQNWRWLWPGKVVKRRWCHRYIWINNNDSKTPRQLNQNWCLRINRERSSWEIITAECSWAELQVLRSFQFSNLSHESQNETKKTKNKKRGAKVLLHFVSTLVNLKKKKRKVDGMVINLCFGSSS